MERDQPFTKTRIKDLNFNSHAHVERDTENLENVVDMGISTHTLTWSVTEKSQELATNFWISTHTLTWSVTRE